MMFEDNLALGWRQRITLYNDVIMITMASQITSLALVYSTVYSGADQRKHQSSASLAFVRGIHRGPVNSPHKWPVHNAENVFIWWRHHQQPPRCRCNGEYSVILVISCNKYITYRPLNKLWSREVVGSCVFVTASSSDSSAYVSVTVQVVVKLSR